MATGPAPDDLELIRSFVNTYDPNDGTDAIADPADLRIWLTEHDLPADGIDEAAVLPVAKLRESLREVLLAHHRGGGPPAEAIRAVNELTGDAELAVRLDDAGVPQLTPVAAGLPGAFAALVAVVYRAALEGTWQRLKVCPADDCLWAFYDQSKNRSRTWCSMEACGNRAKARAYRDRHRD